MALLFQAIFASGLASAHYARLRLPTRLSHTEFTEENLHYPMKQGGPVWAILSYICWVESLQSAQNEAAVLCGFSCE